MSRPLRNSYFVSEMFSALNDARYWPLRVSAIEYGHS